jgi:predicted MPP superfamily phosphohydrolase
MSQKRRPLYDQVSPRFRALAIRSRLHRRSVARPVVVRHVAVPAGLNIRIVLVADFHADSAFMPPERIGTIVSRINAVEGVDMVAIPGDFVGHSVDVIDAAADELGRLEAPAFATLGNHDHYGGADRVTAALSSAGITVLTNKAIELDSVAQPGVWVAGIDSCEAGLPDRRLVASLVPPMARCVVLGHEPFLATLHDQVLHLAGHTHHGQVRIPKVPIRYLPKYSRPYPEGLAVIEDGGPRRFVYTTAGVGSTTLPIRIGAPPEIVVIDV